MSNHRRNQQQIFADNNAQIENHPTSKKGVAGRRMAWMFKNMNYLRAFQQFSQAKVILMRANIALSRLEKDSPIYIQRLSEFNRSMLVLSKARFYGTTAIRSGHKEDWTKSLSFFKQATRLGNQLLDLLEKGSTASLPVPEMKLERRDTEILFADGIPVVPEACPVVILQGNSFEMGYQYAQQLIQIFGSWILEQKSGRTFSEEARFHLHKWEEQIEKFAPEILEMCRGWVKGACDAGVNMSYEDVLDIWTGHAAPKVSYMGRSDELTDIPPGFACAGAAAWGKATRDGKLVTGSCGDHDPSYPVVIMAYPDTGNSFMFTTFSAVGDIALVGSVHMFGHPGMNNKGLAYVEHGGQPRMIEPMKYWGYGLRRAASVMHILRFANNAKEALKMELEAPIGDVGMDNGTIGGFYADSTYGYVLESRKDPLIIREAGHMGETDFLYANNSAMHQEANRAGWMQRDQAINKDWVWDEHAGWHPRKFQGLKMTDLFVGGEGQARIALRGMYYGSSKRNQAHFDVLNQALGQIDLEYMRMIFRMRGAQPEVTWKQRVSDYNKKGLWGDISIGHAGNGVLTVTKPDTGPNGIYSVCIGQARRGLYPNSPFFASFCPMFNEMNSFWELKLAENPAAAAKYAAEKAKDDLEKARAHLEGNKVGTAARDYLSRLLHEAFDDYAEGEKRLHQQHESGFPQALYSTAKSARYFLKAQVKAQSVSQFLVEPPCRPEDLLS